MQCSTYRTNATDSRCKEKATLWLLHPDGSRNPGGYCCKEHGEAVIKEYAEKLKEYWMSEEINNNGQVVCLCTKGSSLATNPCDICGGVGYI